MSQEITDKTHLRKQMIKRRHELSEELLLINSSQLMHHVFDMSAFDKRSVVYAYMDYGGEVQTKEFIIECLKLGKKVALPKVRGKEMDFFYIHSLHDVQPGYQGILEPKTNHPAQVESPFILVPGVAYDIKKNRLGLGGGFYDRYLASHPNAFKAGIAFSFQIFEKIPTEPTDIKMDCIITEDRIYV